MGGACAVRRDRRGGGGAQLPAEAGVTGWLVSMLLALAIAVGLAFAARPSRGAVYVIGVALLFGLAGYAWQGNPGLAGRPTAPNPAAHGHDTLFAHERKVWLETVGFDAQQLDGADAFIHNGDSDYAAGLLHAYLLREPESMML